MKRLLSLMMCFVLLLGLCACGAKGIESPDAAPMLPPETPAAPESAPESAPEPAPESAPESAPEPVPVPLSGEPYTGDFSGYKRVMPIAADASSELNFMGKIFFPEYAADGDISTCWQEGVEGDGADEYITIYFGREIQADLLRLRLGHAKDDNSFYRNVRPANLLIEFSGGESMVYDFPDENDWYTIDLSAEVKCEWVRLTTKSVYGGTEYEDNCISEIAVYSESPGQGAETGYHGGLIPPEQEVEFVAMLHEDRYSYPDPYTAYLDLLSTNRWAWDFGINLNRSSRLGGYTIEDAWGMTMNEYLDEYPVKYLIVDLDDNGVDELIITGSCIIGIIEESYIFTFRDGKIVYLGSVRFTPDDIYRVGDEFVFFYGITMYGCEISVRLEKGVIYVGGSMDYNLDEGHSPRERGLELVASAHERNCGEPYLDPIKALIP